MGVRKAGPLQFPRKAQGQGDTSEHQSTADDLSINKRNHPRRNTERPHLKSHNFTLL